MTIKSSYAFHKANLDALFGHQLSVSSNWSPISLV